MSPYNDAIASPLTRAAVKMTELNSRPATRGGCKKAEWNSTITLTFCHRGEVVEPMPTIPASYVPKEAVVPMAGNGTSSLTPTVVASPLFQCGRFGEPFPRTPRVNRARETWPSRNDATVATDPHPEGCGSVGPPGQHRGQFCFEEGVSLCCRRCCSPRGRAPRPAGIRWVALCTSTCTHTGPCHGSRPSRRTARRGPDPHPTAGTRASG